MLVNVDYKFEESVFSQIKSDLVESKNEVTYGNLIFY